MQNLAQELATLWHRGIPLTSAMQIEIEACTYQTLAVAADLEPNANVHGTAFAGSLYAIAALTGWGMVWLALRGRHIEGDIVLARGEIDYRRPVSERIVCRVVWTPAMQAAPLEALVRSGRMDCALECTIGEAERPAARFQGHYCIRRSPSPARA